MPSTGGSKPGSSSYHCNAGPSACVPSFCGLGLCRCSGVSGTSAHPAVSRPPDVEGSLGASQLPAADKRTLEPTPRSERSSSSSSSSGSSAGAPVVASEKQQDAQSRALAAVQDQAVEESLSMLQEEEMKVGPVVQRTPLQPASLGGLGGRVVRIDEGRAAPPDEKSSTRCQKVVIRKDGAHRPCRIACKPGTEFCWKHSDTIKKRSRTEVLHQQEGKGEILFDHITSVYISKPCSDTARTGGPHPDSADGQAPHKEFRTSEYGEELAEVMAQQYLFGTKLVGSSVSTLLDGGERNPKQARA